MLEIVEGWTERIKQQLLSGPSQTPVDVTGATVVLQVYNERGELTSLGGSAGLDTPASGIVYYDPAPTDFVAAAGPYKVRWKVTDVFGKVSYFPNAQPDNWIVRLP